SSAGVPEDFTKHTLVSPLDDIEAVRTIFDKHGSDVAGVIIEPVPANNGLLLQSKEFLEFLREITETYQSLLIFDEVISGFRVAAGGAVEHYGIAPDLCTYGKVIGGGLPVGAFGGRAEIMKMLAPGGPVYQAGTLSGNPLAMACGLGRLDCLEKNSLWKKLDRKTSEFVGTVTNAIGDTPAQAVSIGSIFWLSLQKNCPARAEDISPESTKKYADLFKKALDAGIYLAPSAYEVGFISSAHSRDELTTAAKELGKIVSSVCR
ncbi:MAG: aminotransferase class III-fold pyridoxal phosphate-dependent enzyme, partial [Candidatus Zixiibacteriota bacterium]